MQIEPGSLALLAAIVETRSFGAAAARRGTSQPAVSREVMALEARLGRKLFDRSVRPAQPTELCLELAEDGRAIAHATEQARQRLAWNQSGESGLLRLAGPPFFMDYVVVPLLAAFQRSRPGVQITIKPAYVAEARALIQRSRVDLAFCPVELVNDDKGIVFTPALPARNVVALRSGHPLLRKSDLRLPNLLDQSWIAPAEGSPLWQDMQTTLLNLGAARVNVVMRSASPAGVLNFLLANDALAILPAEVVRVMSRYGVTELPLDLPAPARTIGILSRPEAEQSRLVRDAATAFDIAFKRLRDERAIGVVSSPES